MKLSLIVLHAERGRKAMPEYGYAIEGAVRLLRKGQVTRNEDGTFSVVSEQDKAVTYHVNGACTCPSYTGIHPTTGRPLSTIADNGWCKHRLACGLYTRAARDEQALLAASTSEERERLLLTLIMETEES